ncbi:MAG: 30S ribosomal protein S3 [Deltaproteobacteria bacterium]|nr:30S ribosomal protein S3 [Deltaproteobacteria bacterium]
MGQKVHPKGFRLGVTETWNSRWYKKRGYADQLHQDFFLRNFVGKRLAGAGVSAIDIERTASRVKISVMTARPGLVIGKKGKDIEDLRVELKRVVGRDVTINIKEVRKPDLDAQLIAENVANQLVRRVAFRRAMKDSIQRAIRMGAKGIKISVAGRLGGSDIARTEWIREGRVPLHTLRAKIHYGFSEALTTYGIIGVKCWVFSGEEAEEHDVLEQRGQGANVSAPSTVV